MIIETTEFFKKSILPPDPSSSNLAGLASISQNLSGAQELRHWFQGFHTFRPQLEWDVLKHEGPSVSIIVMYCDIQRASKLPVYHDSSYLLAVVLYCSMKSFGPDLGIS